MREKAKNGTYTSKVSLRKYIVSATSIVILLSTLAACIASVLAYQPAMREKFWLLAGKRPVIAPNKPWHLVFNLNPHQVTGQELDSQYRFLQQRVRTTSYFKNADRLHLSQYYDEALAHIQVREAAKLDEALTKRENAFREARREEPSPPQQALIILEAQAWRRTLDVDLKERDPGVIKRAYRRKAIDAHPDRGGSHEEMTRINVAYASAKRELGFN